MADPVTLATIGLAGTAGGGLLSAFGAESAGTAQQSMYNYQAAVAKINANIDTQNSEYALDQGERQAQKFGIQAGQQRGAIIAGQGASGIAIGSGSSADVVRSQGVLTGMDLNQIRTNAAKTSYDYTVKATADTNQASLDVMAGENAKTAGDINAASSILSSVGSVASKWTQGTQAGLFGGKGGNGTVLLGSPSGPGVFS